MADPPHRRPALSELVGPYQAWLDTARSVSKSDPNADELVRTVLVLIGLHHGLAYRDPRLHQREALDWRLWGEARF